MAVGVRITNVAAFCNSSAGGRRYSSCRLSLTYFSCWAVHGYQTGTFKNVNHFTWGWRPLEFSMKSRKIPARGQRLEKSQTNDDRRLQSQDCGIPLDSRKENHLGIPMFTPLSMFKFSSCSKCPRRKDRRPIKITNQSRAAVTRRRAMRRVSKGP